MAEEPSGEGRAEAEMDSESFEEDLERLEEVVARLEAGNLPLDESLRLYEEGIGAYRRCQQMLEQAELRISKLVETLEGELKEEPFEPPAE